MLPEGSGEREIRLSLELVDQYGWKALTLSLTQFE